MKWYGSSQIAVLKLAKILDSFSPFTVVFVGTSQLPAKSVSTVDDARRLKPQFAEVLGWNGEFFKSNAKVRRGGVEISVIEAALFIGRAA